MLGLKKLPVGFESFQEIRKLDCYYVDKTKLIEQILENWSKVNLFTRPRRFGKTLNMSMLKRFSFLSESKKLTDKEQNKYRAIVNLINGKYTMDEDILISSLQTLSQLLCQHYGQKAIILIDEYDVPLDKAFQHGYYKEMVSLIRGLFGQALKTNDFLQFAVLTGCLRVSKESIFTGLNNFKVYAADDVQYEEEFGFTKKEVADLSAD